MRGFRELFFSSGEGRDAAGYMPLAENPLVVDEIRLTEWSPEGTATNRGHSAVSTNLLGYNSHVLEFR
jgi:hypothetical protein